MPTNLLDVLGRERDLAFTIQVLGSASDVTAASRYQLLDDPTIAQLHVYPMEIHLHLWSELSAERLWDFNFRHGTHLGIFVGAALTPYMSLVTGAYTRVSKPPPGFPKSDHTERGVMIVVPSGSVTVSKVS